MSASREPSLFRRRWRSKRVTLRGAGMHREAVRSESGGGRRSDKAIPPAGCNMRKKSPYLRTSSSLKMAVRGGLIRFAHRYSARPWASPLRGQRRRCSKMLPAFLCGQPARRLAVCPAGCASCRPPIGVSHPPGRCHRRKKSPYLRTSSSLNMAVRGD